MTSLPKISKRLQCAAELTRHGAILADVGTDHAYLPIYLCLAHKVARAIASDVNEGPLLRAREHIAAWGLQDQIDTVLCDGLEEIAPFAPTDILILGMGGELITDILTRAPFTKQPSVRLILQPMTHPEVLRRFLCENGYEIVEERLVREEKIYQIICAEYTGKCTEMRELALLVGEKNLARRDETVRAVCERFYAVFSERLRGKRSVGASTDEEEYMMRELEEYLK